MDPAPTGLQAAHAGHDWTDPAATHRLALLPATSQIGGSLTGFMPRLHAGCGLAAEQPDSPQQRHLAGPM